MTSPIDNNTPLTAAELEERLDAVLEQSLSTRNASGAARGLVPFMRVQQEFVLRWFGIIAQTHAEMAYQFASQAPDGLRVMELSEIEDWIVHSMDIYDKMGLYPAIAVFREAEAFAREARERINGVSFDDVSGVLDLFVRGLSGRTLKLEAGDDTCTDTATLFLPPRLARLPTREKNFTLYKLTAAHLWAQTWYGTFHPGLSTLLGAYADATRAARLFHALETIRLDACLARDLPGLYRDLMQLRSDLDEGRYPAAWQEPIRRLGRKEASVETSLELLPSVYDLEAPATLCYQGEFFPARADEAIAARIAREKEQFRAALAHMQDDIKPQDNPVSDEPQTGENRFDVNQVIDPDLPENFTFEISLDGQPLAVPPDVRSLMDSIIQDLGNIPQDYLVAAGDGGYRPDNEEKKAEDVWMGTYHEEGAHIYHEWDFRRQHYRKRWCALREIDVPPGDDRFVEQTRQKYAALIAQLRKSFEALRGEEKLLKKQKNGDNIDFDALVEAYADMQHGMELSERVLTKLHKHERNIAVMFMIDMSGSTRGWINDAERESLVLLCEALEILGDRYAIYGFSGNTRQRCELYRIKRFDEPYSAMVRARITGIQPKDYTRMGVTIRHLSKLLNEVDARTKLLITLSDGKPDDYDGYRGDYGIEDTRKALVEARRDGIHPFCITIDNEARDYLPHMYGPVNWVLIDDVRKLPLKVSDIYRRLTT